MKNKNPRLDEYLSRLERNLNEISAGDRAEIITEIKSHVLEAMDREPERTVDSILASLGEPETVANKFLIERGLKTSRPPRAPIVKWLVIGFLGTMAIGVSFVLILLWKFTPLVDVDEKSGKVALLGGAIHINSDHEEVAGDIDLTIDGESVYQKKEPFKGEETVPSTTKEISVHLGNGSLLVEPTTGDKLSYECELAGGKKGLKVGSEGDRFVFKASGGKGGQCKIRIPPNAKLDARVNNGELEIKNLRQDVEAKVNLGKISFRPAIGAKYRYETKVNTGNSDSFTSSTDNEAFKVQLNVNVGKISNRG